MARACSRKRFPATERRRLYLRLFRGVSRLMESFALMGLLACRSLARSLKVPIRLYSSSFPSSAPLMSFSSILRGVRYFSHAASFIIITTNTSLAIHD